MTNSHSASGMSTNGVGLSTPALFTNISIDPYSLIECSTISFTKSSSEASPMFSEQIPPECRINSCVDSARSLLRSFITTVICS